MIQTRLDPDYSQVLAVTEEESAAIVAGDFGRYRAVLTDDAVFLPQSATAKTGAELHRWMREFLEQVAVESLAFAHGETIVRGDLACHEYTCAWKSTPRSGGASRIQTFKGLHVLRKQADGAWKISRNIWNTDPAQS